MNRAPVLLLLVLIQLTGWVVCSGSKLEEVFEAIERDYRYQSETRKAEIRADFQARYSGEIERYGQLPLGLLDQLDKGDSEGIAALWSQWVELTQRGDRLDLGYWEERIYVAEISFHLAMGDVRSVIEKLIGFEKRFSLDGKFYAARTPLDFGLMAARMNLMLNQTLMASDWLSWVEGEVSEVKSLKTRLLMVTELAGMQVELGRLEKAEDLLGTVLEHIGELENSVILLEYWRRNAELEIRRGNFDSAKPYVNAGYASSLKWSFGTHASMFLVLESLCGGNGNRPGFKEAYFNLVNRQEEISALRLYLLHTDLVPLDILESLTHDERFSSEEHLDALEPYVLALRQSLQAWRDVYKGEIGKTDGVSLRGVREIIPQLANSLESELRELRAVYFDLMGGVDVARKRLDDLKTWGFIILLTIVLLSTLMILRIRYHKRLNRRLKLAVIKSQDAQKESDRANRMKSEFLANISHEIRTPMNGLVGMTSLLDELISQEESTERRCINTIKSCNQNLLILLNDLLDLSKIEAGRLILEKVPFEPLAQIEYCVEIYQQKAQSRELTFNYKKLGPIPEQVLGDPTRLSQVVLNLLNNAVKFTNKGGVRVEVDFIYEDANKGKLVIEVEDSGIGIAADKMDEIFEPFRQGDSSITRLYGGTGLGLTITKRLIELHEGTMNIDSEEGRGTLFRIEIPYEVYYGDLGNGK